MNESEHARAVKAVNQAVKMLVNQQFDQLIRFSTSSRLTALELRSAIEQYGRTLTFPPDHAFQALDIVEVRGTLRQRYSVRFDLWTLEEGQSDLSLELTLVDSGEDCMGIEIDDLHTLQVLIVATLMSVPIRFACEGIELICSPLILWNDS